MEQSRNCLIYALKRSAKISLVIWLCLQNRGSSEEIPYTPYGRTKTSRQASTSNVSVRGKLGGGL